MKKPRAAAQSARRRHCGPEAAPGRPCPGRPGPAPGHGERERLPARRSPVELAWLAALALCWILAACSGPDAALRPLAPGAVILAFGDSLTYGTGAPGQGYPERLAALSGHPVVNAGVPGERAAQGLARLPRLLAAHAPALVVLCHGGNDLLRGGAREPLAADLRAMIALCREAGADVALVGVPNPGLLLSAARVYEDVAAAEGVPLDNRTLAAILADGALKSDMIHPNARGYDRLARAVAALLRAKGALP